MRRQFPLFIAVFVLACASGQSSTGGASAAERQRVVNLVPFDLANCFPPKLDLGKTANEYTLQAAFRARPARHRRVPGRRQGSEPGSGHQGQGDHRDGRAPGPTSPSAPTA